jgi:hypothetical protein
MLSAPMKHRNGTPANGRDGDRVMSRGELEAQADRVAFRALGVPSSQAFKKLDRGDLAGTAVEAELKMLRRLMQHD